MPAPTTYAHATFQDVIDQVAQELGDPGKVFFVDQEVGFAVLEALTVWNLLTGWNRSLEYFNTTSGVAIYDLTTVLSNTPLSTTKTVRDVLGSMQYRLMEPYDPVASAGVSEMYTHAALVRAIQQQRDQFLAETQSVVTQRTIAVGASTGEVALNANTIKILRAVWKTDNGNYYNVWPTDEAVATAFIPSWRQSYGIPQSISITLQPQLNAQLLPIPANPGELQLITVESGAVLDTVANTILGIRDDNSWGIGWGAMSALLARNGIGNAIAPASVAQQMYQLSLSLANTMPTVLSVLINNKMVIPDSITVLDSMRTGWQGRTAGTPTRASIIGDLLFLDPVPDGSHSIGVMLVKKTPAPASADPVQLGKEQLAGIVAWAKQLCLFKKHGTQMSQGQSVAGALIEQAKLYNEDRILRSTYLCELYGLGNKSTWKPVRQNRDTTSSLDSDPINTDTASSRNSRSASVSSGLRKRLGGR